MRKVATNHLYLFCTTVLIFFTNICRAQDEINRFEKAITNEFCDSFAKAVPHLTKETWTGEVGMMIVPLLQKYSEQIETHWQLNTGNASDCGAIGEKIGQLATFNCGAFQNYLRKNLKVVDEVISEKTSGIKKFSGKLLRIEGSPFAYVVVQNSEGRNDKFYWMNFFPGAGKLAASKNNYLNQSVVISFKEMEVYHLAEKEYRAIKIITGIE